MRSKRIPGQQALDWGIATECVADDKLDQFYKELQKVVDTDIDVTYKKLTATEFEDIEDLDITITDAQLKALFEFVFEEGVEG